MDQKVELARFTEFCGHQQRAQECEKKNYAQISKITLMLWENRELIMLVKWNARKWLTKKKKKQRSHQNTDDQTNKQYFGLHKQKNAQNATLIIYKKGPNEIATQQ